MKSHFPSITPPKQIEHKDIKISTANINSTDIDGFDIESLKEVIQSFKNKKAAGPDGLKPFILKELPQNKLEELLFIYKTMLLLQFTPTQWTKSKVIWIPKPRKDTYKVFKIMETNFTPKPTTKSNGKTNCEASGQNNDKGP